MADRRPLGRDILDTEDVPCHKRPKSSQAESWLKEQASDASMLIEGEFAWLHHLCTRWKV